MKQSVLTLDLPSRFLGRSASCLVLLPRGEREPEKSLILLHGAEEGPEMMLENGAVAALAEELGLAVLFPDIDNSFGLDWGETQDYRSFLLEELLPHARNRFPVFAGRERCAIGGISMGGFAALSLALSHPEDWRRVFSISGALDPKKTVQFCRIIQASAPPGFAEIVRKPEAQLFSLMESLAESVLPRPALFLAWSEEDWFARVNEDFAAKAAGAGFSVQTEQRPGFHDWDYWRESPPAAVRWAAESDPRSDAGVG